MKLYMMIFCLFSVQAFAASCVITDEMRTEFNQKYGGEILVETKLNDSKYNVVISAPKNLNGESIVGFYLSAGKLNNPTFFAPLDGLEEEDFLITWFEVDARLIREYSITAEYGWDCGFEVTKKVFSK